MTQTNNEREEYENFEAWLCTLNSFSPSELRFGFIAWQAAKQSPISQNEQQEAVAERDKLGYAVVEVIGKLDEIIDVAEDIEFNDFAHIAIPLELWNELKDALELMPERADKFTSPPKQAIPEGWKPIETVPMDGTYVDLWDKSGFRWTKMYYGFHQWLNGKPISGKSWGGESRDGPGACPTHWMPLPSAPTNTEVGE